MADQSAPPPPPPPRPAALLSALDTAETSLSMALSAAGRAAHALAACDLPAVNAARDAFLCAVEATQGGLLEAVDGLAAATAAAATEAASAAAAELKAAEAPAQQPSGAAAAGGTSSG